MSVAKFDVQGSVHMGVAAFAIPSCRGTRLFSTPEAFLLPPRTAFGPLAVGCLGVVGVSYRQANVIYMMHTTPCTGIERCTTLVGVFTSPAARTDRFGFGVTLLRFVWPLLPTLQYVQHSSGSRVLLAL